MILTGDDLYEARRQLGWSEYKLGSALRLSGDHANRGARVRQLERGDKPITGPMSVAVEALLSGFRPVDFIDD